MPIFYSNQNQLEALSVKTGVVSSRLSEQRMILYGGRGTKYDELVYLRAQNTSAVGVDAKDNDAWEKFTGARGVTTSTRSDQKKRDFWKTKTYP